MPNPKVVQRIINVLFFVLMLPFLYYLNEFANLLWR